MVHCMQCLHKATQQLMAQKHRNGSMEQPWRRVVMWKHDEGDVASVLYMPQRAAYVMRAQQSTYTWRADFP